MVDPVVNRALFGRVAGADDIEAISNRNGDEGRRRAGRD